MRNLERFFATCMVLTLACFCVTVLVNADTWDEMTNGGADAGDFPLNDFQMGDGTAVFDIVEGSLDPIIGDEFDSYLITVTDPATFTIFTEQGLSEDDTRLWLWDTAGDLVMANDDDPAFGNAPPWLARINDPSTFAGNTANNPGSVVAGTDYIVTVGGFNSDPLDANGVDLADMTFNTFNTDLIGINPASNGTFFTWDFFTNAAGGDYQLVMAGAQLAGGMTGDGCPSGFERGDVNTDGTIDLLDVTPFVTLLVNGGFQCEADIDISGAVDLLDVTPFVDLLTGG